MGLQLCKAMLRLSRNGKMWWCKQHGIRQALQQGRRVEVYSILLALKPVNAKAFGYRSIKVLISTEAERTYCSKTHLWLLMSLTGLYLSTMPLHCYLIFLSLKPGICQYENWKATGTCLGSRTEETLSLFRSRVNKSALAFASQICCLIWTEIFWSFPVLLLFGSCHWAFTE